jgi:hypothetical protein
VHPFQAAAEKPYFDYTNVKDMTCQPFYMFLEHYWFDMLGARAWISFFLGWYFGGSWMQGMAAVCWTMSCPMVLAWHFTSFVNSAAHIWGRRPYETGEQGKGLGRRSRGQLSSWHHSKIMWDWGEHARVPVLADFTCRVAVQWLR